MKKQKLENKNKKLGHILNSINRRRFRKGKKISKKQNKEEDKNNSMRSRPVNLKS